MCDFNSLKRKNKDMPRVVAPIDKYELYWNDDLDLATGENVAGTIINTEDDKVQIKIIIWDSFMREHHHPRMLFLPEYYQFDHPTIIITSKFYNELNENLFLEPLIWHEVGHFCTLQYFDYSSNISSHATFVERNEVDLPERAADIFAVYYSGKDEFIKALNWLIHDRKQLKNDSLKPIAIAELLSRKKHVKELNEELALNSLYDLCRNNNS